MSGNGGTARVREYPDCAGVKSSDLASDLATAYVWGWVLLLVTLLATGCATDWRGSVGAVLGKDNRTGRVFVRDVPPGMAAERAGIAVDDEITAIDDVPVQKMSPQEVHEKLAGSVGSKVKLTVVHPHAAPRNVVVERGPLRKEELAP